MKTFFCIFLMCLVVAAKANTDEPKIDHTFFAYISKNYENLDKVLIQKSSERHTESAIKLSKQMMASGEVEQVAHGEELMVFLAQFDPRALFSLGRIYSKGVQVYPEGEAFPKTVFKDHQKAADAYQTYLEKFSDLNEELTLLAYTFAGDALVQSAQYEAAAKHLLSDTEKAEQEPIGLAAFTIGNLYLNGDGVEEDKGKALHWFDIAADKGLGIAEVERNFLRLESGE